MQVHIVTKVGEQKWGDWDTHTVPHRGTHVSMYICIGVCGDIWSQIDKNTCTDTYTHSNQGVEPEVSWLQHTHCHREDPMLPGNYA